MRRIVRYPRQALAVLLCFALFGDSLPGPRYERPDSRPALGAAACQTEALAARAAVFKGALTELAARRTFQWAAAAGLAAGLYHFSPSFAVHGALRDMIASQVRPSVIVWIPMAVLFFAGFLLPKPGPQTVFKKRKLPPRLSALEDRRLTDFTPGLPSDVLRILDREGRLPVLSFGDLARMSLLELLSYPDLTIDQFLAVALFLRQQGMPDWDPADSPELTDWLPSLSEKLASLQSPAPAALAAPKTLSAHHRRRPAAPAPRPKAPETAPDQHLPDRPAPPLPTGSISWPAPKRIEPWNPDQSLSEFPLLASLSLALYRLEGRGVTTLGQMAGLSFSELFLLSYVPGKDLAKLVLSLLVRGRAPTPPAPHEKPAYAWYLKFRPVVAKALAEYEKGILAGLLLLAAGLSLWGPSDSGILSAGFPVPALLLIGSRLALSPRAEQAPLRKPWHIAMLSSS